MPSAASEMWFDWASERILLICHTKKSPDVETWSEQCSVVGKGLARDNFGTLVLTDGGGPSSAQREQLAQATEKKRYPISVVSNASIVRFIVSSIALFNPSIHSFLPADWRRALAHLGVAPMELKAIERKLLDFAQHPQAERFTVLKSVESSIRAL